LKVSDINGPESDDSDSSSEDYGEGQHDDISGDVLSEDGELDASTSLAGGLRNSVIVDLREVMV